MWVKDQELLLLRQEIEDLKRQLNELRVGQSGGFRKRPEDLLLPANANDGDIAVYDANTGIWKPISRGNEYTFYVDAINGDDSNDGTASNPLKTLKEACDRVPMYAYGNIYLTGGQTFTITKHIFVHNKYLYIHSTNTTNAVITHTEYDTNNHYYSGIRGIGGSIRFNYITLQTATGVVSSGRWLSSLLGRDYGTQFYSIYHGDIVINDTDLISLSLGSNIVIGMAFGLAHFTHNGNGYIVNFEKYGGEVCGTAIISFDGANGYDLTKFRNLVRDSNGVPRNLICDKVV